MKISIGLSVERRKQVIVAAVLLGIFLFSWYIRSAGSLPDKLLSFDPIFQYRFTRYFAEHATLPVWDELSYYTGRSVSNYPPLIFYMTAFVWWIVRSFGWSLMTAASWFSAVSGAAVVIPAFLLVRGLSNRWGGLLAAALIGTAPQILTRTFGASFDTDQLAIFFIMLTLWTGTLLLRRRTPATFFLAAGTFVLFSLAWSVYWFTFITLAGGVVVYTLLIFLQGHRPLRKKGEEPPSFRPARDMVITLISLFVVIVAAGYALGNDPVFMLTSFLGFAQRAETWIVNVSIAELQLVDIANPATWMLATGRISIGDSTIDNLLLLSLFGMMILGLAVLFKDKKAEFAMLAAIVAIGIVSIMRGIRFTEFSSGLLLVAAGVGWGYAVSMTKRNDFPRIFVVGLGIAVVAVAASLGLQSAKYLGPDISPNWDAAWSFLRSTPELSLVGTWWDPGHMITGLGERRVIADGAHCGNDCLYTINDRITDLGKIFYTANEDEAIGLLRKYQGDSPKIYWIVSDDLIGKFQWLQYFGTGCDARNDAQCPLYYQFGLQNYKQTQDGKGLVLNYGAMQVLQVAGGPPVPVIVEGRNAVPVGEIIIGAQRMELNSTDIDTVRPLVTALNLRLNNQTVPYSVWIPEGSQFIIVIPEHLRSSMFTRMFLLGGQDLQHFKLAFSNPQIRIYEVVF